jgi:hypothetical protein
MMHLLEKAIGFLVIVTKMMEVMADFGVDFTF